MGTPVRTNIERKKTMYLEKIIGNQYRNWKSGEWIFISAPTGTGKTTFVLNQLVPEAQNAGKEVLF